MNYHPLHVPFHTLYRDYFSQEDALFIKVVNSIMKAMECSRLPGDYKRKARAQVRLLHASPGTGPVDVFANGELVVENLTYAETAGYFTVKPCTYVIAVYAAGKQKSLLAEACVEICPNSAVTIAIICPEPDVCLLAIPENAGVAGVSRLMNGPCRACVRFVHLAPGVPPLTVFTADTALFCNVPFKAHTRYRALTAGFRTFRLKPTGSTLPGMTTPEFILENGMAYTLYAIGLSGADTPLTTILLPDGRY